MKKDKTHIHWYPGHIAKAERKLKEQLSLVDAVIEVLDARIPLSSGYDNIAGLLKDKPRLILFNKSDLADKAKLKAFAEKIETESGFPVILSDAKKLKRFKPNRKKSSRIIRTSNSSNNEKRIIKTTCESYGSRNAKCWQIKHYKQTYSFFQNKNRSKSRSYTTTTMGKD